MSDIPSDIPEEIEKIVRDEHNKSPSYINMDYYLAAMDSIANKCDRHVTLAETYLEEENIESYMLNLSIANAYLDSMSVLRNNLAIASKVEKEKTARLFKDMEDKLRNIKKYNEN